MTEDQRELPMDYDETEAPDEGALKFDVFVELDKLSEDEIKEIVEVMVLPAEKRVDALAALEAPEKIGLYYAVYGRYIAPHRPYTPDSDDVRHIIGSKISILATAIQDKLPAMYIWAMDSALLSDITQNTLHNAMQTADAMEEKAEVEEYPH